MLLYFYRGPLNAFVHYIFGDCSISVKHVSADELRQQLKESVEGGEKKREPLMNSYRNMFFRKFVKLWVEVKMLVLSHCLFLHSFRHRTVDLIVEGPSDSNACYKYLLIL